MSVELIQKKLTYTKAFRAKRCEWCSVDWGMGDEICTVSDLITDRFFLLCKPCGTVFLKLRSRAITELDEPLRNTNSTVAPADLTPLLDGVSQVNLTPDLDRLEQELIECIHSKISSYRGTISET